MHTTEKNTGWLYFQVAFAAAVWGGAYPFTKRLVAEISPLSIIVFRALTGSLLLLLFSGSRFALKDFKPAHLWKLLVLSVLGVTSQQYLQAYALKYTLASHAGWLIATTPIAVAGLMAAFGERIGPLKLAAFVLGFAGSVLVVFSKAGADALSLPSTRGDLIFLTSCVGWAFYVLCAKKWLTSWPAAKVTTATMVVALASALPAWYAAGGPAEFSAVSAAGWTSLAYLGVLSSALAYLFWNNAVEGLGAVKSSYFIYLEPFSALLLAYLMLGERAAAPAFAGGLLIMAGVYLVNRKESRRAPKGAAADA
ncbi:MAG: DMT family transporter [Elusimicrobiales bacterium]|nr:DMT family transporter [Elusimicrobiales bacterium]